jgi:hypothetical protein
MRLVHPDAGGAADPELARDLNRARDVALEGVESTALVPLETALELVRASAEPLQQAARAEVAKRTVDRVVMHHVGELAAQRRR